MFYGKVTMVHISIAYVHVDFLKIYTSMQAEDIETRLVRSEI